jgi:hypothetical protein
MPRRLRLPVLIAALCAIPLASPARSATFDVIYTDRVDVTLCSNGCGITLAGAGFALVVNKGTTDIDGSTFFGATFTASSSNPAMVLYPFINNPGPPVAPIHPNEAVGSVLPSNAVLTSLIHPGETFRNTAPLQVLAFQIERTGTSTFAGPVAFDVTMTMGAEIAHFTIFANVMLGDFAISFPSAARVSSVPLATPTVSACDFIRTFARAHAKL